MAFVIGAVEVNKCTYVYLVKKSKDVSRINLMSEDRQY